jgi:septal ring factor EnvC (AmiA/AmiB activator)
VEPSNTVLPAVVAVALAAAVLALAIGSLVGSRQLRRRLHATDGRLELVRSQIQGQIAELRASLDQSRADADQVRAELARLGSMMEDVTDAMTEKRTGMQQLTRHRIGPAVRLFRLAGTAARIAYLWR